MPSVPMRVFAHWRTLPAHPDAHIMMTFASLLQEGDVVPVVTHSGRTSDVRGCRTGKKNVRDYLYNA